MTGLQTLPWRRQIPLPRRIDVWAALGISTLVLVLFKDAVFGGQVLYERDIHLNWYGQIESFVHAVASGCWPVWDPYISFGQPLLADPSAQILYPPTWLNLVMRPWTYYTLFVVSHLIFSALGVYALGQRLGISAPGSLAAAAIWVCSGPLLSLVNVYHHFAGAAWMPWVLLGARTALASGGLVPALLWGATAAMQALAGSADMCLMTGLIAAVDVLGHLRWRRLADPSNRRILATCLVALLFALALAAVQWLPTLEVARRSDRWSLPAWMRTYWSIHPVRLVEAFFPVALHNFPLQPQHRELLFEGREPFLFSLYLGMPALGLVVAAFGASSRFPRRRLALVGLAAAVFSLGRHSPGYDLASQLLPPLQMLRYPEKAFIVAAFAWALLVGAGYDTWDRRAGSRRTWWVVCAALAAAAACAGGGASLAKQAWWALGPGSSSGMSREVGSRLLDPHVWRLWGTAGVTALVFCLAALRGRSDRPWLAPAAAILAVTDLATSNAWLNPTAPKEIFTRRPPTLEAVTQTDHRRLYVAEYSLVREKPRRVLGRTTAFALAKRVEGWPPRASAVLGSRLYLLPPTAAGWGLEGSYDIDARGLFPPHLARLTQVARAVEGTPAHLQLLRLGAVGRVVALHEQGFEGLTPIGEYPSLFPDPIRVFGVPGALPRTYVVGNSRTADGMQAIETLLDPGFDSTTEVLLPEGPQQKATPGFAGTSRILELRPDRVRIEADLNQPGYVVLVDSHDPEWRASVDGRQVELLRANVGFRAVHIAAGRHAIEFRYRPAGVRVGALMSACALLGGLAAATRRSIGGRRI